MLGNEGTFYDPYAAQGGGDSGFVAEVKGAPASADNDDDGGGGGGWGSWLSGK